MLESLEQCWGRAHPRVIFSDQLLIGYVAIMSNHSILFVEDEAIIAEDLAGKVRSMGYEVAGRTASGEEALELAGQLMPDLVLMDIRLAGAMDGIEAAQRIHREYNLPILFLTANPDLGTDERVRQAGAVGSIMKPFDKRDISIQIDKALNKTFAE